MHTVIGSQARSETDELESFQLYPWIVLVSASLFFLYEFMQLNLFNAIDLPLRAQFGLNATELGRIAAYYAYANLLFLFPAGILLDRFSTKKIIIIAMMICAGATFAFANAEVVWVAKLCRFMTGIGGSFCFLSCIRLASRWFPPKHMALATGIIVTLGMSGGALAQAPLTYLVQAVGWRHALMIDSAMGIVIISIIIAIVRDFPKREKSHYEHAHEVLHEIGFWRSIKLAFSNRQNYLGGLYTSLFNLPIALLGSLWGIPYLRYAKGISLEHASLATMMLFVGTIVGGPIIGEISDKILRRKLPMLVGGAISLVLMFFVIYLPVQSYISYMILFFILGVVTSCQILAYPLIAESNPSYLTGTCMSIASMLILGGYAVFQPIFGKLMDLDWHGRIAHGVRIYSSHDFSLPMLVFPIAFIVALVAAWLIKETFCQAVPEE